MKKFQLKKRVKETLAMLLSMLLVFSVTGPSLPAKAKTAQGVDVQVGDIYFAGDVITFGASKMGAMIDRPDVLGKDPVFTFEIDPTDYVYGSGGTFDGSSVTFYEGTYTMPTKGSSYFDVLDDLDCWPIYTAEISTDTGDGYGIAWRSNFGFQIRYYNQNGELISDAVDYSYYDPMLDYYDEVEADSLDDSSIQDATLGALIGWSTEASDKTASPMTGIFTRKGDPVTFEKYKSTVTGTSDGILYLYPVFNHLVTEVSAEMPGGGYVLVDGAVPSGYTYSLISNRDADDFTVTYVPESSVSYSMQEGGIMIETLTDPVEGETSTLPTEPGDYRMRVRANASDTEFNADGEITARGFTEVDDFSTRFTVYVADGELSGKTLEYTGSPQELVEITKTPTSGKFVFAEEQAGPYSEELPKGTEVSDYTIWYKTVLDDETELTDADFVTSVIGKAQSEITTAPVSLDPVYNGSAQALVTEAAGAGGTVVYSLSEAGTYSEEIPVATNAGDYEVWYKIPADDNHTGTDAASVPVTLSPKTVGLTWTGDSFEYDGEAHCPTATATGVVTGESCTVTTEGEQTLPGTYTATAKTLSNTNYKLPTDPDVINFSFVIFDGTPEILTAPVGKSLTYDGTTRELVTAGSAKNGTIVYSDAEDGVYTETIPTAKNAGDYIIWYKVKGDDHYQDSDPVSVEAGISPLTVELTWNNLTFTYDGEKHKPTAQVSNLKEGDSCTVMVEVLDDSGEDFIDAVNAGTYTAVATEASNINYVIDSDGNTKEFKIEKATAAIDTEPAAKTLTYNGAARELVSAGTSEEGEVVYSDTETGTYSATIPTGITAGTHYVWYKVVGDSNHSDSDPVSVEVEIGKKTVGLTWSDTTFEYDGAEHCPTATATGLVTGDTCTVTVTGGKINAGTYTATATALGNTNYQLPAAHTTNFTISKALPEIVTEPGVLTLTYDGTNQVLVSAGTVNHGTVLFAETETGVYSETLPEGKNAGDFSVWYKIQGDENYEDTDPVELTGTIAPKTVGLTWNDLSFEYDGTQHCPTATATGLITGDTCTVTVTGGQTDAGTYTAEATALDNTNYILPAEKTTEFTIGESLPEISVAPAANLLTYDGTEQELVTAGTVQNGTILYGETETGTYSETIPAKKNAGTYSVWYKVKGDLNYKDIYPREVVVTIEKKTVGLTWDETEFVYDAAEHCPQATATGVVTSDTCTVTVTGGQINAGTYTATADSLSNTNYALPAENTTSFTIGKALPELVTAPAAVNPTYNGAAQELLSSGSATNGTVLYSETRDGVYDAAIPSKTDAGSYTVWYMVKGDDNYEDISPVSVSASVEVLTATLNWTGLSFVYDESAHMPSAEVGNLISGDSCLVNLGVFDAEGEEIEAINAGTYTAKATGLTNSNYALPATVTQEFVIEQAAAVLENAPVADSLTYNGQDQELFINGTASGGTLVYSTSQTGTYTPNVPTGKNAGAYTYWYKVKGDANHSDTLPVEISAEIAKKTVGLTWDETEFEYDGTEHCPTVVATGIEEGDTCTVTVTGGQIAAGTYTATATALSDSNYDLPAENTTSFTIGKALPTVTKVPAALDLTYNAEAQTLLSAGTAVNGTFLYSETQDGTYTDTIPEKIHAGEYPLWYMVKGDDNYQDISPVQILAEISPLTASLSWDTAEYTYDGTEHCPAATVSNLAGTDSCDVAVKVDGVDGEGAPLKAIDAGTYTAVAMGLSNTDYALPSDAAWDFTIQEAAPTLVTAPAAAELTYDGEDQTLLTSGTAVNGTLVYSATETGTYSESIPTGKEAKEYSVWYMIKGNPNYSDTEPVKITVQIAPKTVGLVWENITFEYDGAEHCPTATATGLAAGDVCDVTVTGAASAVGTHTATATELSNANYALPALNTREFEIGEGLPVVSETPAARDLTYNGAEQTLVSPGSVTNGTFLYSNAEDGTYSETVPTGKNAGTYTIWYMVKGDANYKDLAPASLNVTVSRLPAELSWSYLSFVYDGFAHKPEAEVNNLVSGDTCDVEIAVYTAPEDGTEPVTTDAVVPGTYTAVATGLSNDNYSLSTDVSRQFVIGNDIAILVQEPTGYSLTYNGEEQELCSGGVAEHGTIMFGTSKEGSYSSSVPVGKNAGTYEIWYYVSGDEFYDGTEPAMITATIGKKTVGLEWTDLSFLYDGKTHLPKAAATGLVSGDVCEVKVTGEATDAGTYTATAISLSNENYALPANYTASFTIGKDIPIIKKAPAARDLTENGSAQELVTPGEVEHGTMLYSMDRNDGYSTEIPKGTNAGEYKVWYKVNGDRNYKNIDPTSLVVTIAQKKVDPTPAPDPGKKAGSVSVSMGSYIFGGSATTPVISSSTNDTSRASVSYKPAGAPDSAYVSQAPSEVGTYTVLVSLPENDEYTGCAATCDFSITYLNVPDGAYTIEGKKKNGWYTSEVQLIPGAGYEVSVGNRQQFTGRAVVLSESNGGTVFFVRKADTGEQSAAIQIMELKIDTESPQIPDVKDGSVIYVEKNKKATLSATDKKKVQTVSVDGKEVTFTKNADGSVSFDLPSGKKRLKVEVVVEDEAGNETKMSLVTAPIWMKDGVIEEGDLYLENDTQYKIPAGSNTWTANGDPTLYMGGISFYANEGDYTFSKH